MPIYGDDYDGYTKEAADPGGYGEIEFYPVSSSHLSEVGYDENNQVLYVRFYTGSLYQYFDVPPDLWDGLLYSSSKGTYLHQNIKAPGYAFEQLE